MGGEQVQGYEKEKGSVNAFFNRIPKDRSGIRQRSLSFANSPCRFRCPAAAVNAIQHAVDKTHVSIHSLLRGNLTPKLGISNVAYVVHWLFVDGVYKDIEIDTRKRKTQVRKHKTSSHERIRTKSENELDPEISLEGQASSCDPYSGLQAGPIFLVISEPYWYRVPIQPCWKHQDRIAPQLPHTRSDFPLDAA